MKSCPLILPLLGLALASPAIITAEPAFDDHWRDNRAELNGYRLVVNRYGQPRTGHAVLIYVTEPFSRADQVKADNPGLDPSDTIDVLKLNLIRDFQTGIYDYNTMISTFHRVADGDPLKVSFSSAEWCGHVYDELLINGPRISGRYQSYFQGESTRHTLPRPAGGILEDSLWTILRGLSGAWLAPGEERTLAYLPGLFHGRLAHQPLRWTRAILRRGDRPTTVRVPAGAFATSLYEIEIADGRRGRFHIEQAYPHRVIRWELPPDVSAELTGSTRLAYWQRNANGDESYLAELGLAE